MTNDEASAKLDIIKRHALDLAEHFDTIQIFATYTNEPHEGGGTHSFKWGTGNWFARYGIVREWLGYHDGRTAEEGAGDVRKEND